MEKTPPLLPSARKRGGGVKYQQFLKGERDENGKNVSNSRATQRSAASQSSIGFGSQPKMEDNLFTSP